MNTAVKPGDSMQILATGEILFLAVALLTLHQLPMLSLASAMLFFVFNAAFF